MTNKTGYVLWLLTLVVLPAVAKANSPNIVLILADNLGWADTAVYVRKLKRVRRNQRFS